MSPRRTLALIALSGAVVLSAFALLRAFDNPEVAWSGEGDYKCSAPWDTARNGADNVPGGEPPIDADVVAAQCRAAGNARFDQAYVAGAAAIGLVVAAAAAAVARPAAGRRGVALAAICGLLATSTVAGLGWLGWERQHPTAFTHNGASQWIDVLPVGTTIYFGVTWPGNPDHDVVVERAHPVVTHDTAASKVEVVVCKPGEADGAPIGSSFAASIDDHCDEIVPIWPDEPDVSVSSAGRDQLLIGVTTSRAGRVDIAGIEIVYRDGWRSGRQVVAALVGASTPAG